ncbi:MAG: methionine--tRNA ligase [Desulfurococcales archaeon]|nr:methionine--tRNA ligase [Desulfurococcales archaeon]
MAKIIVTSAWPYVNNVPHLGTLIGSLLSADFFARAMKLSGHEVIYVTGSDEHGTPIELEARKRGIEPRVLTDQVHDYDLKLFNEFNINFSLYSRTESEIHKEFVREMLRKIYDNSYIFEQTDILPYCPNDKMFLPDRYVEGTCPYCGYEKARGDQCDNCGRLLHPTELINPHCVLCGVTPIFKETKHWFIDLRKLQNRLKEWLANHKHMPENIKKYSLSWLETGLKPRAVTRDIKWGIPASFPGAEGKTVYVWFDALLGYVSATKEYLIMKTGNPEEWKKWWFNQETRTYFFIGKDNIPFHSIIFPAMLMASGDPYVLPYIISATEYLTFKGEQFSKSRGIGIWADEALEIAPSDYWRWVLARIRPEQRDMNFSWKEFYRIVNTELNDTIGNLAHRVLTLIYRKLDRKTPCNPLIEDEEAEVLANARGKAWNVVHSYEEVKIRAATEGILEIARLGNQYLNASEPWKYIKTNRDKATGILWTEANILYLIALTSWPIIPNASTKLWIMLGQKQGISKARWSYINKTLDKCVEIPRPEPLFKKLREDFLENAGQMLEKARKKARLKRPPVLKGYKVAG